MHSRPTLRISEVVYFICTLALCALLVIAILFLAVLHGGNDMRSFSEPVCTLSDGWTLTDSEGNAREITLPQTIKYGKDGVYTLSGTLPKVDGQLLSPAFRFYSNYVDVHIAMDGETLCRFPVETAAFSGATGNTYHFVRMPVDYAGKTITIDLRCQLGPDITYLLNPPLLGSKATMLNRDVMRSLPAFTLAGCMGVLAIALCFLYFIFRKHGIRNHATLYTSLFTMLFAIYVYFETSFAQLLMPNGYLLCFTTLMLLALLPIPLLGVFLDAVSPRYRSDMCRLMQLCAANCIGQICINFFGIKSVRALLPITHLVLIISILTASLSLYLSSREDKPDARRSLLSAVPMIIGGVADIVLLNINHPSPNNSLWFTLGVTVFIIHQLNGFIRGYFALYRTALASKLLSDMAYHDALADIGNRNAYERKLKVLSEGTPSPQLCCIVMDINDLKLINDTLGHAAGDTAIAEIGAMLSNCMPDCASCFRTGGDEFVVLLEEYEESRTQLLAQQLADEAERRGAQKSIPFRLAIGYGQYATEDGNIIDFIRRIDTRMYECKRAQKAAKREQASFTVSR